jgi:cell surface protein SprA
MFLTGFEDTVVCRFAKLELIRNQWRRFSYEIDTSGVFKKLPANDPVKVDVLAVNVEENDQREPIPYKEPPGIERQQQLSNNNVPLLLNEQSLSLKFTNLTQKESRGVFKTINYDLRQYGKLDMFVHAENGLPGEFIKDKDLNAVIRIGNDFATNYYEIRVPLKITQWGTTDSLGIWPEENNLALDLQELVRLKTKRNAARVSPAQYFSETIGDRKYAIIGNPNLGEVKGIFLGIENLKFEPITAEIWFNELRLSHLDEKGGWAAIGRLDIVGADLLNINATMGARSTGFGTLEQKVNERSREDYAQFDISANIDAGKLLPRNFGMQIPIYAGISHNSATPEFDPYDLDIRLKDKLKASPKEDQDSIKSAAIDETTIKTITLTNVKKLKLNNKKPRFWDVSNLDFNYSFTKINRKNPLIDLDEMKRTRGAISYNYAPRPKYFEPFKNLIKSSSKWLSFIKDFNLNYSPTQISFRADVFRQFGALQPKNVGGGPYKIPESYDKYFTFDRYYIVRWDLSRSISLDYNAINNARIDEPAGRIDTKEKKETVRKNFFDGGRNTHFHQDATFTYNFPTIKFPLIDWTSLRASYKADYDWIGTSLLAKDLGNIITNGKTTNLNADLGFEQLYTKSRFLRAVYSNTPATNKQNNNPPTNNPSKTKTSNKIVKTDSLTRKEARKLRKLQRKEARKLRKAQKQNSLPEVNGIVKGAAKLVTSLKRVGIQYTETAGSSLPGYLDSTRFLGQNWKSMQPGFDFILGYQPDTNWVNKKGNEGVLTKDPRFNALFLQRYDQRLNLTALVSPVRDLTIDINMDKTFTKNYSDLFKDTSATLTEGFKRLNPYSLGGFSISYISYQTLFKKFDPNIVSETFRQFENNRLVISEKLDNENLYSSHTRGPDGYYQGYGRYAQDVLIPAFISAYTNKDPLSISMVKNSNPKTSANPFNGLKAKPNWNITYNATSIKGLEKTFTNLMIRHGYRSTLSMNSYNSALFFQDPFHYGYPSFIDPLTKNFVPYFLVPNITIMEEFSPLVGVDMTFTNRLTARMEYRKTRQLSLSLIDYQLAENHSTELTVGADWIVRGVPLIKKIGKLKLDNDITFKLDFSIRDDATANSKLDQNTSFGTAGQKVININPTIDYVVNSRIRATFYFQQQRTIPKIATTAPITNTRAGVQLTVSLAQ